jgi:Pyruvate/2-oxoacid:ferredoxin oxidoreductase gamma subunit
MAAHLEGRGVGVLDMAGLAQKGGAVFSYIRFAESAEDIHAIRVAAGRADLVLGGDIVVAGTRKILAAVKQGDTVMVVNTAEFLPGEFTRNADFSLPSERLKRAIAADAGPITPISSTPRASRLRCSANRSAPTCSWSATPISSAPFRCRPPRSRKRSSSTARRLP